MKLSTLCLLLFPLLVSPVVAAQDSTAAPQVASPAPDITTTVRAVVLDVVVTDTSGKPVHGLTKSDFILTEDGVPQQVQSFRERTPPPTAAAPLPKYPPNYFTDYVPAGGSDSWTVVLIDAANNPPLVQEYVRQQLVSLMKTLPPGNQIAIFELNDGVHLVQGFTADPEVLLKALESKRADPSVAAISARQRGWVPQKIRQDDLVDGLRSMGRYLAGFPGRKNLIWFSGSIPRSFWGGGLGSPFPDTEDFISEISDTTDALSLNKVAVYPIDARGLETDPGFSAANSRGPTMAQHNAFVNSRFYDHADIDEIAARTGGKAFYNTNGLKQAVAEVIDSSANYYTLAYTPSNKNWDGKHRTIKIELSRSGLQLEYRHGYFARNETARQKQRVAQQKNAAAKASMTQTESSYEPVTITAGPRGSFSTSMALGAIPPTEVLFSISVTPGAGTQKLEKDTPRPPGNFLSEEAQKKPYRNYAVLYRVDAHTLQLSTTPEGLKHGELQFVTIVYDEKGEKVNSISTTSKFDVPSASLGLLMKGGASIRQTIAVPAKGSYFFRFGVHDIIADHSGVREVPVDNVQMGVVGPMQKPVP
ncbi:VWA domain-containing protein [Granulicella sp. 5B5]|uniref:VWA domain-containing protein n=1 Tax=Granulicella sp. 5B5 TaxID=1617967 RepID=UPI0015F3D744|nr:VWA domain-containing protein [Granulicella sp. 5B5]